MDSFGLFGVYSVINVVQGVFTKFPGCLRRFQGRTTSKVRFSWKTLEGFFGRFTGALSVFPGVLEDITVLLLRVPVVLDGPRLRTRSRLLLGFHRFLRRFSDVLESFKSLQDCPRCPGTDSSG